LGRRGRVHVNKTGNDVWVGGNTITGVTGMVRI